MDVDVSCSMSLLCAELTGCNSIIVWVYIAKPSFVQDLLWTMVPQWDFFHTAAIPHLPRPWQVHNHCLSLSDRQGISGSKVSQWELYRCMREKYGEEDFSYMPETFILPRLESILKFLKHSYM